MTRSRTALFAVSGGVAVGNLYWAQPLLAPIAEDVHTTTAAAGTLVTTVQFGYAAGILLIVPLGDLLDRRRLIPVMLLGSAVTLTACALAPTFTLLAVALTLLGVTTVSGQLLTPLAGDLAGDGDRGSVVGTVTGGILAGVLLSRTLSGLIAGAAGWRAVCVLAALCALLLAVLLHRSIPPLPPRTRLRYPALLASVLTLVRRERAVRWTLALGAIAFSVLTLFWTALTFLLSGPPFAYPVTVVGAFGLAGLAGVLAVRHAGRLHDRGRSLPATGAAWALAVAAFVLAAFASRSVLLVIVTAVLLDAAVQTVNVLNQSRVLALAHTARSRVNTAMVTSNFIGGATGSAVSVFLWSAGGWTAVTIAGTALSCLGFTVWTAGRRGALTTVS
ncbi:MFS transporter [Streptomyces sp. NPDC005904]|uniref:MFS transporter n=1 Tax=Streptomyces sp. NPDC005904 TaxID=3154570 RepID=UPI0033C1051F